MRSVVMDRTKVTLSTTFWKYGSSSETCRPLWPQVRLHLTEGSSAQLEEWLGQGRLDMALLLREEETAKQHETVVDQRIHEGADEQKTHPGSEPPSSAGGSVQFSNTRE